MKFTLAGNKLYAVIKEDRLCLSAFIKKVNYGFDIHTNVLLVYINMLCELRKYL